VSGDDEALLRGAIKEYYIESREHVVVPDQIASREFGYQKLGYDGMIRHQSLPDEGALRVLLSREAPTDVYCSNARYLFPSMPMKEKEWQGADLIFDIDAKDLDMPCREGHSVAVCSECSRVSPAGGPCAACSSSKVSLRSLPCQKCIKAAHDETEKLKSILCGDLGVDPASITVYFSGNEGYHTHVRAADLDGLGSRERRELADYVMFRGAVAEAYGVPRQGAKRRDLPARGERGWRGRLAAGLGAEALKKAAAGGRDRYQGALEAASAAVGARIDPQVTGDIHRIFRMPGSLNGKSGLSKVRAGPSPAGIYAESCLLADRPVEVLAECPHRFSVGRRRSLGPYSRERATVPLYAAVYMVCKGVATAAAGEGGQGVN